MMRGKSPPSEQVFRENQVAQLFWLLRGFEKGENFIFCQISLSRIHIYFNKNDKN